MRYTIVTASNFEGEEILRLYPVLKKYNPQIDYPYSNGNSQRLTIATENLSQLYDEIGYRLILSKNTNLKNNCYTLTIYDDWLE